MQIISDHELWTHCGQMYSAFDASRVHTYLECGRRGDPSEGTSPAFEVGAHLSTERVVGLDLRGARRDQARVKDRYPRKDSTGSNNMKKKLDADHVHTCSYTTMAASTNLSPIHLKMRSHS